MSGRELLELQRIDPANDPSTFAGRLVDYITDAAMIEASDTENIKEEFLRIFDAKLLAVLAHLDKINPRGAAYVRAGICESHGKFA